MIRRASIVLVLTTAALVACEDEKLLPTSNFVPTECQGPACDNGARLDGGGIAVALDTGPVDPGEQDAGVPVGEVDSGAERSDSGATQVDAGVWPDASAGPDVGFPPPDAGPPPEFLNLAGSYRTHYLLDLSRYLGGISNLAGPLDFIDQAIVGNVNTGVAFLDQLILQAVQSLIPPWLAQVISVLNSIANFFEEVEADGLMNIRQSLPMGATSRLDATEVWNVLTVRIIDGCPRGRMDPNYPACARQRIPIAMPGMVGPLEIGVDVKPFSGVLQSGRPQAALRFDDREIDMELTRLVRVVLDLAINIATNGQIPTLRDALDQAIDCVALGMAVEQATNAVLGAAAQRACDREKMRALDAIINAINGIGIGWEVMQFDQIGRAIDTNGNNRPETIQTLNVQDTIDGRFRALVSDRLSGEWEGINLNP